MGVLEDRDCDSVDDDAAENDEIDYGHDDFT
jgi:hypothetical protein